MIRIRKSQRDPVLRAKLALRNIEDNLCFTRREAWAWFVLPTQPWAFRSDTQREQLLYRRRGCAGLAGRPPAAPAGDDQPLSGGGVGPPARPPSRPTR